MRILRNILFLFLVTNLFGNTIEYNTDFLSTSQTQSDIQTKYNKIITNEINSSDLDKINSFNNPLYYEDNFKILSKIKEKQDIQDESKLLRFNEVFFRNKNKLDFSTLPVPDFYEINSGDKVSIWVYGTKNQKFELLVDNKGNINIPKIGPLSVKGISYKEFSKVISSKLKPTFKNSDISVNISSLSSIQVNLVGFVKAPGLYNLNSLSTIKDLLIIAGGVKSNGSVRNIVLNRDGKKYKVFDFYQSIIDGDTDLDTVLKANDTIYIPKAKNLVGLDGEVETKAIFELKDNETLDSLIKYSGGLKASSNKYGLKLKRFIENKNIKVINIDINSTDKISLKDGDRVYVYSINKNSIDAVKIYGNVLKPGEIELTKNRSLKDLLNNQIDKKGLDGVFLTNTLFNYALIKRVNKDLENEIISFSLKSVIDRKVDIKLRKNDEIFILNKLNSSLNPFITIIGNQVLKPGKYQFINNMTIKDLLNISGIKNPFTHIRLTTVDEKTNLPKNLILDKTKANSYKLKPFDKIYLLDSYNENNIKIISISGEVLEPNSFLYHDKLTLNELIQLAGGLSSKAYKKNCEIIRYEIVDNIRKSKLIKVDLENGLNILLKPYDEVHIKKIPLWNNKKTIKIEGEVLFPGEYIINDGEKLVDLIKRSGGYTKNAFLKGAVFTRENIKKLQKKNMEESVYKLKQKLLSLSLQPSTIGEGTKEYNQKEMMGLINSLEENLKKYKPLGRISINLEANLDKFSNSSSNLTLENKDKIIIPSVNDTVLILGEVMSPTAIIYDSSDINDYIKSAGGLNQRADDKKIYVVHANGSSTKVNFGWLFDSGTTIEKGDVIVVPQELVTYSGLQIAKDLASISYQFALIAATMNTIGAFNE